MNISLDLPLELESELSTEASQLNLSLSEYILRILSIRQVLSNPPKTGAELVAYGHKYLVPFTEFKMSKTLVLWAFDI